MASTERRSSLTGSPVSFLRAIDGSHLRWSDFRTVVLGAFRIVLTEGMRLADLSQPFSDGVKRSLQDLDRFVDQEREWRSQLSAGKGFGSTMIFPPNVLPTLEPEMGLHRCLAPKMNREALPPRAVKAQESLFELPTPRPGLLTAFATVAFSETELSILPHCTASTGTVVDFTSGYVSPGTTGYCAFLAFERLNGASDDAIETGKNQCAVVGAHCVRAMQLLFRRCSYPRTILDKPIAFSCAIDNSTALIYYHFVETDGRYCMSEISRFNLDDTNGFREFQGWIVAIETWGSTYLLPLIKIALGQLLKNNSTPPISPMPSLTLSIDTAAGSEEVLLKILRTTFSTIKWKCEGEYETPLNSSVAHCGTPLGARKIRTMALSPTSPGEILSAATGPSTPFSRWRMKPDWGNRSPLSRRHPLSPLQLRSDAPDSPVRRATLSPCTPPPDAPFSAKSPMLVLQKRVDLAMDEIQELRALVQTLQGELKLKESQLESEEEKNEPVHIDSHTMPPTQKFVKVEPWLEKSETLFSSAFFAPCVSRLSSPLRDWSSVLYHILFIATAVTLGNDVCDVLLCLAASFAGCVLSVLHGLMSNIDLVPHRGRATFGGFFEVYPFAGPVATFN
ncbi:hypothetical protein LTR10_015846 [Elasticomyces elasticus]|uniref:DUF7924 domain-containing protein n=1 Tax=Exophiala sideris TaxID=1016849 RepID=A0ABR0IYH1_9EURO|nr:hypothetical protein LTR10_015846 [Elasticomyces elasticus]KAK5022482.1 hypothetical protein LTS07_009928 [Exophiala sideris]KAK5028010.1 hypothetical protein LTR13_009239 [Exophiala sideris]KAK5051752.1 hypothetical protein LTR69_010043 [Exophiala sideris]KAK5177917.1 hypothetical protein LTR44_009682 [Eurotiomycetes sp. CCFEE 6388]